MRVWAHRQVVRGFLRKRVILEVNYSADANSPLNRYRPATAEDSAATTTRASSPWA
jgi:hypothetical protein